MQICIITYSFDNKIMLGASCLPIGAHTAKNQDNSHFDKNYEPTITFLDKGKSLFIALNYL